MNGVYVEVSTERHAQERLKREGRFTYSCADPEADHGQCFAVLLEEIGEAAQALSHHSTTHMPIKAEYVHLIRSAATLGEIARTILNQNKLSNDPPVHRPDRNLRKELIQVAAVTVAWLEGFEEKS